MILFILLVKICHLCKSSLLQSNFSNWQHLTLIAIHRMTISDSEMRVLTPVIQRIYKILNGIGIGVAA